jgi:hypothetical protein
LKELTAQQLAQSFSLEDVIDRARSNVEFLMVSRNDADTDRKLGQIVEGGICHSTEVTKSGRNDHIVAQAIAPLQSGLAISGSRPHFGPDKSSILNFKSVFTKLPLPIPRRRYAMVFPFGISLGDFVGGLQLIHDTLKALDRTHGASSDYRLLRTTLEFLISGLGQIDSLQYRPSQTSKWLLIRKETESCRQSVNAFLTRIDKFAVLKQHMQIHAPPNTSSPLLRSFNGAF